MFGLSQDNGYSSQHPRWVVVQSGADKPPAYPLRPVADRGRGDGSSPPAAWVVIARFPYGKVFAYLPPGSLLGTPSCPLFSCGRIVFPLINRVSLKGKRNRLTEHFSNIFSCSPSPADRPLRHALGGGNRLDRVAQQIVLKDPLALCVWQTVQERGRDIQTAPCARSALAERG